MDSGAAGLLIVLLPIYFLPAIVASNRKHPSSAAIFIFNLFLGWTFLGWVLALVWAASGPGGHRVTDPGPINVSPARRSAELPNVSMDKWSNRPAPAQRARATQSYACPECDGSVRKDANFCSHCGAGLVWD